MNSIGKPTTMMRRSGIAEQTLITKQRQEIIQNALTELADDKMRSTEDRFMFKMQVTMTQ